MQILVVRAKKAAKELREWRDQGRVRRLKTLAHDIISHRERFHMRRTERYEIKPTFVGERHVRSQIAEFRQLCRKMGECPEVMAAVYGIS